MIWDLFVYNWWLFRFQSKVEKFLLVDHNAQKGIHVSPVHRHVRSDQLAVILPIS